MENWRKPFQSRTEAIQYPGSGQVTLSGRLSTRYQGNRKYLLDVYETKGDWMLEPFRYRGCEWVLEPLRNRKQEASWAGEYAGKWLDAACLAAAGEKDGPLSRSAAAFAAALIVTQEPDGYLGIEVPDRRGARSGWDVWNVKYAMTGLLTHFEVYQADLSLQAAVRCGEWLIEQFGTVSGSDHPFFNSPENGGVNVTAIDQLARLYRVTGEEKFLEFAAAVVRHFPLFTQMRSTHQAPSMHAYTLIGCLGGVVELALAAPNEQELGWVERVWENLVDRHLYPTGSLGFNELLSDTAPNDTPVENGEPGRHHQETCATVEWLLLNARLYQATGSARYVQKMEQTIYNALLAAQSMDGLSWMYFTPLRYEKRWFTGPTSCCYWSGPRGVARLPGWVYSVDGEGIRVNLYESGEATFRMDGCKLTITQSTLYPDSGTVNLQISPESPTGFTLRLRIPAGAGNPRVFINGTPVTADSLEDSSYPINRVWSKGDRVEMEFDIPAAVQHFHDDCYGLLVHGPEVFAVDQGDNPGIDLDQMALQEGVVLREADPGESRRRYQGEIDIKGKQAQVVFTPYADCGGKGSRFRTAFPIREKHG